MKVSYSTLSMSPDDFTAELEDYYGTDNNNRIVQKIVVESLNLHSKPMIVITVGDDRNPVHLALNDIECDQLVKFIKSHL